MKKYCQNPLCENNAVTADKRAVSKSRSLKLLPYEIRENLPILGSQQRLGGKMKVLTRWLTPDGSRAWHITEGSARRDTEGKAVDYLLYGLVEGERRELYSGIRNRRNRLLAGTRATGDGGDYDDRYRSDRKEINNSNHHRLCALSRRDNGVEDH